MKDTRLPALPALSARYLRYVMAFGVTLAVGLAPLLGGRQIRLPGFVAFLDFFPISMQRWLVPFAAFVMAMPAIAVQFYATEIVAKRHLRGVFRIGLGVMAGMLLLLCSLYTLFTLQVSIP